jgi:hypothetical protein
MTDIDASGKNIVFIVGSPRSGTTWLSRLMGAHDDVAATQETELLNRYVQPLYDGWDGQLPADEDRWSRQRHRGLPSVLTAEEFEEQITGFVTSVYRKLLTLKPSAHVVVDKNPAYSLHVDVVRRLFPDAAVLHIVRDGRDVAASMLAASRGWGRDWAPADVRLAARTWRTNVEAASAAAGSGRYLQIRYEDLLADGPAALAGCLAFAGVSADPVACAAIVARFDSATGSGEDSLLWSGEVASRLGGPPPEPAGFAGASRGWRETWTARDRLDFDYVAGDLLRSLGYVEDSSWAAAPAARLASTATHRMSDAAARLGWRLHMWLGRRGLYVQVGRVTPYGSEESAWH